MEIQNGKRPPRLLVIAGRQIHHKASLISQEL
jgi:hypothetical protein